MSFFTRLLVIIALAAMATFSFAVVRPRPSQWLALAMAGLVVWTASSVFAVLTMSAGSDARLYVPFMFGVSGVMASSFWKWRLGHGVPNSPNQRR